MNMEITYTSVDTDALDFLKVIYFGVIINPYEAASKRAYLDMNRTIRFNGMPEEKRTELRTAVTALLEKELRLLSPELYLYLIGVCTFVGLFEFLLVPLDNYVFDVVQKKLGISRPKIPWSRWDDYTGQYDTYQNELRSRIQDYPPLRWEFKFWMKEARQHTVE